jgi:hypothetical protein
MTLGGMPRMSNGQHWADDWSLIRRYRLPSNSGALVCVVTYSNVTYTLEWCVWFLQLLT